MSAVSYPILTVSTIPRPPWGCHARHHTSPWTKRKGRGKSKAGSWRGDICVLISYALPRSVRWTTYPTPRGSSSPFPGPSRDFLGSEVKIWLPGTEKPVTRDSGRSGGDSGRSVSLNLPDHARSAMAILKASLSLTVFTVSYFAKQNRFFAKQSCFLLSKAYSRAPPTQGGYNPPPLGYRGVFIPPVKGER